MTLRDQLGEILPRILPHSPDTALNGTSLLERVRSQLKGEYSDQTVRQHFSVMANDPTSPIARVSQGHGYYLRASVSVTEGPHGEDVEIIGGEEQGIDQGIGRSGQREEKFRALFIRDCEIKNRFPVHIEHTTAIRQPAGVNKWKFPDVVVLDWDVGRISDAGYQIDKELLEVRRSLGDQPFRLTSVELKAGLSLSTFRESFFQCVSNSKWAHHAYLITANPIQDETLVTELRRLGASFDISVLSYGLSNDALDQLPNADEIRKCKDQDFERFAKNISISRISSGRARDTLDWEHIEDIRTQSADVSGVFVWISRCLKDEIPYSFDHFQRILSLDMEKSKIEDEYK